MPDYTVTHPTTGKTITITGDTPPSEAELDGIFAATGGTSPVKTRADFIADQSDNAPDEKAAFASGGQVVHFGGNGPVSTMGIATPRQQDEAAAIKTRMQSPTPPPKSLADFATRVIPESAAKVVMGAYQLPAAVAGDVIVPALGGDIGEATGNAATMAKGVVNSITKPIGLQGLDAVKEAWSTDPVGSGLSMFALKPAVSGLSKMVGVAGDVGAGVLGATTGTSKNMVKQAAAGGPDFVQAMRGGEEGGAAIVQKAKDALQQIKNDRGDAYRAQLDQIAQNSEPIAEAPKVLQQALAGNLKKFGAKVGEDGTVDFSRSTFNRKAQGDVADIIDTVNSWGTKEGDLTPLGLDTLKRQLDDFYSDSKNSKAMVSSLRDTVKNLIVDKVPEYADMTKGYAEASGLINELDRTLSLGKKPMIDTTLRKLTQSMRDNFQFRKELLDTLSGLTGENLPDMVAGYNMSSWAPQGGFGKLTSLGAVGGAATHVLSPAYLSALAMASPRAVGESLRAMGLTNKAAAKVYGKIPVLKKAISALPSGPAAMTGAAVDSMQQRPLSDPLGIRQ